MGLLVLLVYVAWTGHLPSFGYVVGFFLGAIAVALNDAAKNVNKDGGK